MADPTEIRDLLLQAIRDGDARRAARANEIFTALTEREQRLVREAAVLGYVHGRMAPDQPVPKDSAIVQGVLQAVDLFPDLYPVLSAEPRPGERS